MISLAQFSTTYRSKLIIDSYKNWIKTNDRVLDVGCGNGIVTEELKKYFHIDVTGCDMLNYLQVDLPFIQMHAENKLPFKQNSFDIIMFNDVLHHTAKDNQEKLLQEALRAGDKVLIFEVQPTF